MSPHTDDYDKYEEQHASQRSGKRKNLIPIILILLGALICLVLYLTIMFWIYS